MTAADGLPRTAIEERVARALHDAGARVEPNPDLFARVARSVEADRERRRWRQRTALKVGAFLAAITTVGVAGSDIDNGRILMPWWLLELLTTIVLIAVALVLGPFIKRFGRSYAADVFRANPRTGKSYLVLTDVAYYLIFLAYILFSMHFEPAREWGDDVVAAQVQDEVARVGGILLLLGILHAGNIVMLPVIGRLLSLNRRLDEGAEPPPPAARPPSAALAAGAWVLRIEPAEGATTDRAPVVDPSRPAGPDEPG